MFKNHRHFHFIWSAMFTLILRTLCQQLLSGWNEPVCRKDPITASLGLLAPTEDGALFPGLGQGTDSFDSVLGFKWTCDFSRLVALRENGRVMADRVESTTDMEKTNKQTNESDRITIVRTQKWQHPQQHTWASRVCFLSGGWDRSFPFV